MPSINSAFKYFFNPAEFKQLSTCKKLTVGIVSLLPAVTLVGIIASPFIWKGLVSALANKTVTPGGNSGSKATGKVASEILTTTSKKTNTAKTHETPKHTPVKSKDKDTKDAHSDSSSDSEADNTGNKASKDGSGQASLGGNAAGADSDKADSDTASGNGSGNADAGSAKADSGKKVSKAAGSGSGNAVDVTPVKVASGKKLSKASKGSSNNAASAPAKVDSGKGSGNVSSSSSSKASSGSGSAATLDAKEIVDALVKELDDNGKIGSMTSAMYLANDGYILYPIGDDGFSIHYRDENGYVHDGKVARDPDLLKHIAKFIAMHAVAQPATNNLASSGGNSATNAADVDVIEDAATAAAADDDVATSDIDEDTDIDDDVSTNAADAANDVVTTDADEDADVDVAAKDDEDADVDTTEDAAAADDDVATNAADVDTIDDVAKADDMAIEDADEVSDESASDTEEAEIDAIIDELRADGKIGSDISGLFVSNDDYILYELDDERFSIHYFDENGDVHNGEVPRDPDLLQHIAKFIEQHTIAQPTTDDLASSGGNSVDEDADVEASSDDEAVDAADTTHDTAQADDVDVEIEVVKAKIAAMVEELSDDGKIGSMTSGLFLTPSTYVLYDLGGKFSIHYCDEDGIVHEGEVLRNERLRDSIEEFIEKYKVVQPKVVQPTEDDLVSSGGNSATNAADDVATKDAENDDEVFSDEEETTEPQPLIATKATNAAELKANHAASPLAAKLRAEKRKGYIARMGDKFYNSQLWQTQPRFNEGEYVLEQKGDLSFSVHYKDNTGVVHIQEIEGDIDLPTTAEKFVSIIENS